MKKITINVPIDVHAVASSLLWFLVTGSLGVLAVSQMKTDPLCAVITGLLVISLMFPMGRYLESAIDPNPELEPPAPPSDTPPNNVRSIKSHQKFRPQGKPNLRLVT